MPCVKQNSQIMTSPCSPTVPAFRLLNRMTDRHETWHERDVIGGQPSAIYLIYRRP
jgi:hypothetical protein